MIFFLIWRNVLKNIREYLKWLLFITVITFLNRSELFRYYDGNFSRQRLQVFLVAVSFSKPIDLKKKGSDFSCDSLSWDAKKWNVRFVIFAVSIFVGDFLGVSRSQLVTASKLGD